MLEIQGCPQQPPSALAELIVAAGERLDCRTGTGTAGKRGTAACPIGRYAFLRPDPVRSLSSGLTLAS